MGDPEKYRDQDEIKKYEKYDPIIQYQKKLISQKICDENELNVLDENANKEIDEAKKFAESSPNPSEKELFSNIYAEKPWEE